MATQNTTTYLTNTTPSIASSQISTDDGYNTTHHSCSTKSPQLLPKHQIISQQLSRKKPLKNIFFPSDDSCTSSKTSSSLLSMKQTETFHQRIEQEYDELQRNEAYHRCYIENSFDIVRAHDQLRTAEDGNHNNYYYFNMSIYMILFIYYRHIFYPTS